MSKYVYFEEFGLSPSGKTKLIHVKSMNGDLNLGEIRWFPSWRKYTFQPLEDMIFDNKCMNEISDYLEKLMLDHKVKKDGTQ